MLNVSIGDKVYIISNCEANFLDSVVTKIYDDEYVQVECAYGKRRVKKENLSRVQAKENKKVLFELSCINSDIIIYSFQVEDKIGRILFNRHKRYAESLFDIEGVSWNCISDAERIVGFVCRKSTVPQKFNSVCG